MLCWCGHPEERHPPVKKCIIPFKAPKDFWDCDFYDWENIQYFVETKCLHCSCQDFKEKP